MADREARGIQLGLKQGVRQGLKQGVRQGKAALLKRQLKGRFGDLPGWVDERLEKASLEELEIWAERVLFAKRLEDVFDPE